MRQASLKIKTYAHNVNIMNNNVEAGKLILNTMLAIFVALALWYLLILGTMVFNIAERKTLEKEALTLSNEVGKLELSYLSISGGIDVSLSSAMGFKETKATFVTRKALSLQYNGNEI